MNTLIKQDKQRIFFKEDTDSQRALELIKTHNRELQERLVKMTGKEYRFENTDVGQGHYFTDLTDCLEAARSKSKESPAATFLIETFRPKRMPLATIKNNVLTFAAETSCHLHNNPTPCFYWTKDPDPTHRPFYCRIQAGLENIFPCHHYEPPEKPFTVQTAEKTDPDIRILRKSNYGRQPILEIVKNLTAIAESKCINQPAPREASLWNAIDLIEDFKQLSDWINKELDRPLVCTEPEGYKLVLNLVKKNFLQETTK